MHKGKTSKKILLFLVTTILVASIFLTSCSLFKVSEDRKNSRVALAVKCNNLSTQITRGEAMGAVQSNAYIYMMYFGKTPSEAVDMSIESLWKRKYRILFAIDYFAKKEGKKITGELNEEKLLDAILSLLRPDEKKYIVEQTNNVMQELFDSELKKIENKKKINEKPKAKAEDKDELPKELRLTDVQKEKIRPSFPKEEKDKRDSNKKYKRDTSITEYDVAANEWEKKPIFDTKDKKLCRDRVKNKLEKQKKKYQDLLLDYASERIIEKYKEEADDYANITVTDEEISKRYEITVKNHLKKYTDKKEKEEKIKTYEEAIKSHGFMLLHHKPSVAKVKSILFKFSEDQEKLLENAAKEYGGKETDEYKEFRKKVALDYQEQIEGIDCGIRIRKSNEKYDSSKKMTIENYPYVLEDKKIKEYKYSDILKEFSKELQEVTELKDKIKVFDKWIHLVNDDPGMYRQSLKQENIYTFRREGETGYVKEYENLGRALLEENEVGICKTDKDPESETEEGITFCINDFGIQLIFVVDTGISDTTSNITVEKSGDFEYYQLTLDAEVKPEEWMTVPTNSNGKITLKEYLVEIIQKEKIELKEKILLISDLKANKSKYLKENKKEIKDIKKEIEEKFKK